MDADVRRCEAFGSVGRTTEIYSRNTADVIYRVLNKFSDIVRDFASSKSLKKQVDEKKSYNHSADSERLLAVRARFRRNGLKSSFHRH